MPTIAEGIGRPIPMHATGSGVVKDCIFCGLPYALHDHAKQNWLACPDELLKALSEISWPVQGRQNNLRDWLLADNRLPQHRGRNAALVLIAKLWWRAASGIETEGHDPEEGHGAEHESPAA